jgi:hypothetical protein
MNELKKKFLTNISIALLLIVFFLYAGADYLGKEIEASSGKIVADRQSIHLLRAKNEQLDEAKKQQKDIQLKMENALSWVIDQDKTVDFIEEAERTAQENKVKLRIKAEDKGTPPAESSFITSSDFGFTVGGSFDGVMHFLSQMENFKYCVHIEDVKMVFDDFDEYNKEMIVLSFNVKLYQKASPSK